MSLEKQSTALCTVSLSGVGGNPPPLKDDLGPPAHHPAAGHTSAVGVAGVGAITECTGYL